MPNTHSTLTSLFGDIADAIRAKTGNSGTIVADNFPTAISNIPSGLEYETGTYTPTSDVLANSVTISFTNTHSSAPMYIMLVDDATNQLAQDTGNSLVYFYYNNCDYALNAYYYSSNSTSTQAYGTWFYGYRGTATSGNITTSTNHLAGMPVFITSSSFSVPVNTKYYRSGRHYKWMAIWEPAT